MAKLVWDQTGERFYETGVQKCVLYTANAESTTSTTYGTATAWNGISSISENPSGAEANAIYADDIKYLNLYSAEEFGATIEAYTYPEEFEACDGSAELISGATVGQQERAQFGLCYRTAIGNDVDGSSKGYKLHLIYGCKASPSSKDYATINDSPEAITFSWEISTVPVDVTGFKPTATIVVDSTKFTTAAQIAALTALENALYGTDGSGSATGTDGYLPLPDEVKTLLTPATST